ncbi:hypothetical protein G6F31_020092 [Rhizopus arrhizus]|nr:hypothetical protein G6F31_020092 [Rhizopus arrhizus]
MGPGRDKPLHSRMTRCKGPSPSGRGASSSALKRHRHVVAVIGDDGAIHADLARLVDDHARVAGRRITQVVHQQRGLAAAQEAAQQEEVGGHVRMPLARRRRASLPAIRRTAGARRPDLAPSCP